MAQDSRIEWTDATWNPVTGCTKVSAGCKNCYAERMAKRLHAMGVHQYRNDFKLTLHPEVVEKPLQWRKPKRIFVNSMSDLFHPEVPGSFIRSVFDVIVQAHQHSFQVLTKRPERALALATDLPWPENLWLGTSIENALVASRAHLLAQIPAYVRFLSVEPLLGPIPRLPLNGIDWVIVGGESGPGSRPIEETWVLQIREQCLAQSVPFFFKQWGGTNKKRTGRLLDGRTWDAMPTPNTGNERAQTTYAHR